MRSILFLLTFCVSISLRAQSPTPPDLTSTFQRLDTTSNVQVRIGILRNTLSKVANIKDLDRLRLNEQLARNYIQLQKLDSVFSIVNESLILAEKIQNDTILAKFHNIKGGTYYYLRKKEEALYEFTQTVELAHRAGFSRQEATTLSNMGAIYIEEKKYSEAEAALQTSIGIFTKIGQRNTPNSITAQRLLGTLLFDTGKILEAKNIFQDLVQIAKETNSPDAQISAQIYLAKSLDLLGQTKEAISNFEEAIHIAQALQNTDSEATSLLAYSKFQEKRGNYKMALELFQKAWNLKKTAFEKQLADATSDAEVKYQTALANKEKEIAQLEVNRTNTELDLAEKKQQQQWWIIISLILVISSVVIISMVIARSRKQKAQQAIEKERIQSILTGQEKERERVAKDLHDGIVQDLAAIKHKLQLSLQKPDQSADINSILEDITRAGSDVRNISYQLMPLALREYGLQASIEALFERTKLIHQIDYECTFLHFTDRLPEHMEVTIYRVVQELIHNAVKHSQTKTLHALFKKNETNIQINFEDNGIGFNEKDIQEGIGLNSIKSRVEMVGGTIEKDFVDAQSGTVFYIKLPI